MPATANPSDGHTRTLDTPAARSTVEHALTQGPLPKYTDLQDTEQRLRAHLELLLPQVEAHASPELIKAVHAHMDEGMGEGLMSARIHVRQLAHDTRSLLHYTSEGQ